jgi:LysM repeat protein
MPFSVEHMVHRRTDASHAAGREPDSTYDGEVMTISANDGLDPPWCPLLGVVSDRRTHFTYPHTGHRCFAGGRPVRIGADQQSTFCLTAAFPTCARFELSSLGEPAGERQSLPTAPIEPAPAAPAAASVETSPTVVMYVVGSGDSLARVAKAYGLTVADVAKANGLTNDASLADGDRLVIPIDLVAPPRVRTRSTKAARQPVDGAMRGGRSSGSPSDA